MCALNLQCTNISSALQTIPRQLKETIIMTMTLIFMASKNTRDGLLHVVVQLTPGSRRGVFLKSRFVCALVEQPKLPYLNHLDLKNKKEGPPLAALQLA